MSLSGYGFAADKLITGYEITKGRTRWFLRIDNQGSQYYGYWYKQILGSNKWELYRKATFKELMGIIRRHTKPYEIRIDGHA